MSVGYLMEIWDMQYIKGNAEAIKKAIREVDPHVLMETEELDFFVSVGLHGEDELEHAKYVAGTLMVANGNYPVEMSIRYYHLDSAAEFRFPLTEEDEDDE